MSVMQTKLAEQAKVIDFLKSQYEKDTGRNINLPSTLGDLLQDNSIVADEKKDTIEPESRFAEAVEELRLPKGEAPKKGERKKKEIQIAPH